MLCLGWGCCFYFQDYPAAQHSLVAWVTSFCAPGEDAEPTISCFQQRTARPGCTKPAGQSQLLAVAFSTLSQGGLSPHHTGEAVWVESRHRVLSIPRWGLVVDVYVSSIPAGSPGGSQLLARDGCSGKGRLAEVVPWNGVVQLDSAITWE